MWFCLVGYVCGGFDGGISGSIERHVFNYVGGVLGGGAVDIGGGRLTLNY